MATTLAAPAIQPHWSRYPDVGEKSVSDASEATDQALAGSHILDLDNSSNFSLVSKYGSLYNSEKRSRVFHALTSRSISTSTSSEGTTSTDVLASAAPTPAVPPVPPTIRGLLPNYSRPTKQNNKHRTLVATVASPAELSAFIRLQRSETLGSIPGKFPLPPATRTVSQAEDSDKFVAPRWPAPLTVASAFTSEHESVTPLEAGRSILLQRHCDHREGQHATASTVRATAAGVVLRQDRVEREAARRPDEATCQEADTDRILTGGDRVPGQVQPKLQTAHAQPLHQQRVSVSPPLYGARADRSPVLALLPKRSRKSNAAANLSSLNLSSLDYSSHATSGSSRAASLEPALKPSWTFVVPKITDQMDAPVSQGASGTRVSP